MAERVLAPAPAPVDGELAFRWPAAARTPLDEGATSRVSIPRVSANAINRDFIRSSPYVVPEGPRHIKTAPTGMTARAIDAARDISVVMPIRR